MASNKNQTIYVCSECGEEFAKWQGKCLNCGAWNTLREIRISKSENRKKQDNVEKIEITNLEEVKTDKFNRNPIGIFEIDRVLGGGFVPGSLVLLAGEPGIGKSTLVMQVASHIKNTLYISGEESIEQIKMRADRLLIKADNINILTEINIDNIIATIRKLDNLPDLIIVDSIQTMYSEEYPSTAGSTVQVRETALQLQQFAKKNHIPMILIGHVTKDGTVAGPKTLEHMVDVVLNLEGERYHGMRLLRASKNRYGSTDEIGIFEITSKGLQEIKNPSKIFIEDSGIKTPGSVVCATIEGSRPLLVEIQALSIPTVFGYPKRTAAGYDINRLQLIIAVLTNRGGLNLSSTDVYLNVSGGYTLREPAADLAVAIAVASAFKNIAIDSKTIIFGELALNGDIRSVSFESKRISEAKRLGFINYKKTKNITNAINIILK